MHLARGTGRRTTEHYLLAEMTSVVRYQADMVSLLRYVKENQRLLRELWCERGDATFITHATQVKLHVCRYM